MRVLVFLIVLLILPISPAWPWSKADTGREILYQGLHLIDWAQTITIAQNPDQYHENNFILGKHPSVAGVNIYMGASAILHLSLTLLVPDHYRGLWQWASIIGTAYVVGRNHHIGVRISL